MAKRATEETQTRQQAIRSIIKEWRDTPDDERQVQRLTQHTIRKTLEEKKIYATQSTVSRDLKDMNLVKSKDGGYDLSDEHEAQQKRDRVVGELRAYAASPLTGVQLRFIRSRRGHAHALEEVIEGFGAEGVLGTLVRGDVMMIMFSADEVGEESINVIEKHVSEAMSPMVSKKTRGMRKGTRGR